MIDALLVAGPGNIFTSDDLVNIQAKLVHQFGNQLTTEQSNDQFREELVLAKNQLAQITATEEGLKQEITNLKHLLYDATNNEVRNNKAFAVTRLTPL